MVIQPRQYDDFTKFAIFADSMDKHLTLNCGGDLVTLDRPLVMGIINITPDSFYGRSRYAFDACPDADIIDFGACSTRPGGEPCSEDEEILRLKSALPQITDASDGKLTSIDTFRPKVARYAIDNIGVDIINDVSGGCEEMYAVAAESRKAYVLTYNEEGGAEKMLYFFSKRVDTLARMGVADIIIDPGLGFGKSAEQNFEIIRGLEALQSLGLPVLCGVSRKSFIYNTLGIDAENALNGTTALNTILLGKGVDILRVHDTKEALEAIKLYKLTV